MKILIVTPYTFPHAGGLETIVDLEMRLLGAMGHEVVVVTSNVGKNKERLPREELLYGARVIRIAACNWFEDQAGICWPVFSPIVVATLWKWTRWCDAVHVHGKMLMISPITIAIARMRGKRCLLSVHGMGVWCVSRLRYILQNTLEHSIGRFCLRFCDCITTQQRTEVAVLEKLSGHKTPCTHLPNPLQPALFYPPSAQDRAQAKTALEWNDGRKKVLFAGRINEQKGCDLLLQATDARYDIIFCGDGTADMLTRVAQHGCTHLPAQLHRDMLTLYHACDVLVLPSRAEGQPMVVGEALLAGLPVVVTPFEGAELFRKCRGIFETGFDPATLKQSILCALETDQTNGSLSALPIQQILPTEEEWTQRIVELLKS